MLCTNMSNTQRLRDLLNLRLTADDKEIFELLDGMIGEHEGEVHRLKEENKALKVLDAVFSPQVRLYRTDVQQLLLTKEECIPEQEWKLGIDQKHIKEEQKNVWINRQVPQLHQVEGADIKQKFSCTAFPVKRENDDEKPQSSPAHQSQSDESTEVEPVASSSTVHRALTAQIDQEDYGGPRPASNSGPSSHLQPDANGKGAVKNKNVSVSPSSCNNAKTKQHKGMQASEKEFSRPVQCKRQKSTLDRQMRTDTGRKLFQCSECDKKFEQKGHLFRHRRVHTGEKPFGCRECGKKFGQKGHLNIHMRIHTGEKPFVCSECGKGFGRKGHLNIHMVVHIGHKPFICSECGESFRRKGSLNVHMKTHGWVGSTTGH
ncbi:zinc finger protein 300-like isoform X2 [Thalassophryne amazonica]|uniref:zinc finger protein 300-like isoform X2 n=1 Tax=Thalassophryne amazonica TaxID=390379 RepID=UPI0014718713|nr:zinc finger protein 300-like isoform X2 [Thalassophryne amazonica]